VGIIGAVRRAMLLTVGIFSLTIVILAYTLAAKQTAAQSVVFGKIDTSFINYPILTE
jgi:hypothetical protein